MISTIQGYDRWATGSPEDYNGYYDWETFCENIWNIIPENIITDNDWYNHEDMFWKWLDWCAVREYSLEKSAKIIIGAWKLKNK